MECIIFSDSHGHTRAMRRALSLHPNAAVVFFLGDGLSDLFGLQQEFPAHTYVCVRGNCDFTGAIYGTPVPKTEEITLMGHKIVLTHGDLYGAKYGEEGLLNLAKQRNAKIVLFGHTHDPLERYEEGVWLFNPGSVGEPHGGNCSFGLLTLNEDSVLFSHGEIE